MVASLSLAFFRKGRNRAICVCTVAKKGTKGYTWPGAAALRKGSRFFKISQRASLRQAYVIAGASLCFYRKAYHLVTWSHSPKRLPAPQVKPSVTCVLSVFLPPHRLVPSIQGTHLPPFNAEHPSVPTRNTRVQCPAPSFVASSWFPGMVVKTLSRKVIVHRHLANNKEEIQGKHTHK